MIGKNCVLTIALLGFSNLAHGIPHNNSACAVIEKAASAMAVHASNWENATTTRTPNGGVYKPKEFKCQASGCKIIEQKKFKMVYLPSHPDANLMGLVKFPDIDKNREYTAMSVQAQIIRNLGVRCAKKVNVYDQKTSAMVEYKSGQVKMDVFNFKSEGKLDSWVREAADGSSQIFKF